MLSILYGPDPTTFASGTRDVIGKTFGSTIGAASVVKTYGHVLSCWLSVNTTLLVPSVATFFIAPSRLAGPFGSLMPTIRLNEYTTAAASRASPLLNFRPSRRVHV